MSRLVKELAFRKSVDDTLNIAELQFSAASKPPNAVRAIHESGDDMLTRREYLRKTALAGAALTLPPGLLQALEGDIIKRAIPSTGEEIPVVGLGSSATFRTVAQSDDVVLRGGSLQEVDRSTPERLGSLRLFFVLVHFTILSF